MEKITLERETSMVRRLSNKKTRKHKDFEIIKFFSILFRSFVQPFCCMASQVKRPLTKYKYRMKAMKATATLCTFQFFFVVDIACKRCLCSLPLFSMCLSFLSNIISLDYIYIFSYFILLILTYTHFMES